MREWEKVRLGDVVDTCLGKMLDQRKNRGEYQPYLANVNVRWGSFDLDNLPQMRFEKSEQERYGLRYGDLVICEGGEPGRCAIWKDQVPNMKIQKALHRVRVHPDLDYRYLFYWFLWSWYRGALVQYYTGSTIKHMPGDKLKGIMIDKPPLSIQTRIADILSAYDDLIENNQKQIRLLEEAARRLYKEWFVDFHFPGHESVTINDGVPNGWKQGVLSDIAYESGKNETKANRDSYQYYLPIDCLSKASLSYTSYNSVSFAESSLLGFHVGDILFGALRPYFHKVAIARDSGLTRSTCFVLNSYDKPLWAYLVMLLFSKNTVDYATQISVGTTMPYTRWKDFQRMPVIIPTQEIAESFSFIICPFFDKISVLSRQIMSISEARDRLLPKLMSGELEVH